MNSKDEHTPDEKGSDRAGIFGSGSSGTSGLSPHRAGGGGHVAPAASRANPRVKPSDVAKLEAARRAKLKRRILGLAIAEKAAVDRLVDGMSNEVLGIAERSLEDTKESRFADWKRSTQTPKDTRSAAELVRDTESLRAFGSMLSVKGQLHRSRLTRRIQEGN